MPIINGKHIDGHNFIEVLTEIKNCPFCGGVGEIEDEGDWGSIWVRCKSCGAEGAWVDRHDECTEQDAINKWNNRV